MKPSHIKTPRTMDECKFTEAYVSAEPRLTFGDVLVAWVCAFGAVATVLMLILVPEF